jgi:hypothetical protein
MIFVRFTEYNHRCDNQDCSKPIDKNVYGWHCADCDFDLCPACFPYTWTPVDSFDSAPDSAATLQLHSPPSSDNRRASGTLGATTNGDSPSSGD